MHSKIIEWERKSEETYELHIQVKEERNQEMKCENRKEGKTSRKYRIK
jgi:hypothetical protein